MKDVHNISYYLNYESHLEQPAEDGGAHDGHREEDHRQRVEHMLAKLFPANRSIRINNNSMFSAASLLSFSDNTLVEPTFANSWINQLKWGWVNIDTIKLKLKERRGQRSVELLHMENQGITNRVSVSISFPA